MTDQAQKQTSDWVGDIVALEAHIEEAMDKQLQIEAPDAEINQTIKYLHDTVRDSKHRAEQYLQTVGGPRNKNLVERGAEILGVAAGIIDKLRHDTASKALRDDYTAYNHLAISYTMLYTTALAEDDQATASFAEQGLRTYASLVQKLNEVMPKAVLGDLKANANMPVAHEEIVRKAQATIDGTWKATSH